MSDENNNEQQNPGFYALPSYQKLLLFPNFKSKLAKKLQVKLEILINKKSLEVTKPKEKQCEQYTQYLSAEINLIQHILNIKEIKDGV
jgi:hypothetical protein